MKFYPFRAQHLDLFEWQSSHKQFLRFKNIDYVRRLEADGIGWTGVDDEGIVGCAGLMPEPYGMAAWAAFSERIAKHPKAVVRFVRQVLMNRDEGAICALVAREQSKAARFAEMVGFRLERSPASDHPAEAEFDLYRFARGE